jgi:tRNA pseudouridine38-40 synthase
MPTYRLTLEYEGTRYRGWQEQQNARSVAGELRRAIADAAGTGGEIKDLGGAGRTDAGVHALAQAAHLRLGKAIEPEAFRRAVNDRLPPDIHLLSLRSAPADFHARHSAVSRSYLYQISCRRTALAKRFVWWVKNPLDTGRMQASAALLAGRHDFKLFCERPAEQTSTLVVVESVELTTTGSLVLVRLVASHFLWKMVRRVVGSLVEVGNGRLSPAAFAALLVGEAPRQKNGGLPAEWTAPPSGLFLERVLYPGDPPLGAIAPAVPVPGEFAR